MTSKSPQMAQCALYISLTQMSLCKNFASCTFAYPSSSTLHFLSAYAGLRTFYDFLGLNFVYLSEQDC